MYLRQLTLENFRGFESLEWSLPEGSEAGWHVLLGPNGAGKSSFLRAVAIGFIGMEEFRAARRPSQDFIRRADGVPAAVIKLKVPHDPAWDEYDSAIGISNAPVHARLEFRRNGSTLVNSSYKMDQALWGKSRGWFSAAFGPMRRFTGGGGDAESLSLLAGYPHLARHLSIFDEDVALTQALEWLRKLRFKQLERAGITGAPDLLDRVRDFVNQRGFLPYGAQLAEVSSEAVTFVDGNGVRLPVVELSDGYRAVLSMTFELVRLMADRYGEDRIFSDDSSTIVPPGVVLIDEIDAHLHPSWQREIGPWLTRLFPNVQFIVTTHSPYICQTAQKGSVWTLPAPGSGEPLRRIEGEQLTRVLYGDESRLATWVAEQARWDGERRERFVADFREERYRGVWERMKRHAPATPSLRETAGLLAAAPEAHFW